MWSRATLTAAFVWAAAGVPTGAQNADAVEMGPVQPLTAEEAAAFGLEPSDLRRRGYTIEEVVRMREDYARVKREGGLTDAEREVWGHTPEEAADLSPTTVLSIRDGIAREAAEAADRPWWQGKLRPLFEKVSSMIGNAPCGSSGDLAQVDEASAEFQSIYMAAVEEMTTVRASEVLRRTEDQTNALQRQLDAAASRGDVRAYKTLADQQRNALQRGIDDLKDTFDPTGMQRLNALAAEFQKEAEKARRHINGMEPCGGLGNIGPGIRG